MGMRTRAAAAAATSDGSPPSYPAAQQQQQHRPPSRTGENGMMGTGMQNGYPPSTPQMQHHQHMNPGTSSSPPPQTPGSPYRSGTGGLKRKMPDSSPIGGGNMGGMNGGGGGNMMGPPHMPGHPQMQPGLNGFSSSAQAQTAQGQAQRASPRPMSAGGIGMPNMGMGNMSNMSMNMSGPSILGGAGGIGGIAGIGNLNLGMGAGVMNSNMGGGMMGPSGGMGHSSQQPQVNLQRQHSGFLPPNIPPQSIVQPSTPSQNQTMQNHQHQAMLMAQASSQGIEMQSHQQQIRQGSLPPTPTNAGAIPTQLGMGPTKPSPSTPSGPSRIPSVAPPLPIPTVLGPGTASAIAASGISGVPSIGPSTSTGSTSSATQPILPPLPAGTNLNANVTRVTVVPLMDSDKTIPPLNEKEKSDIQEWMKIDNEYETRFKQMKERMNNEMRTDVFGPLSVNWWEKGAPSLNPGVVGQWRRAREPFDVRYVKKNRDGGRGRKPGRREGFRL